MALARFLHNLYCGNSFCKLKKINFVLSMFRFEQNQIADNNKDEVQNKRMI